MGSSSLATKLLTPLPSSTESTDSCPRSWVLTQMLQSKRWKCLKRRKKLKRRTRKPCKQQDLESLRVLCFLLLYVLVSDAQFCLRTTFAETKGHRGTAGW